MSNDPVNPPVEKVEVNSIAASACCMSLSSVWSYYWFTNPPAALAGRFGCTE